MGIPIGHRSPPGNALIGREDSPSRQFDCQTVRTVCRLPRIRRLSPSPCINDRRRRDLFQRSRTATDHCELEFVIENIQNAFDALLAECGQAPNVGAADPDGIGTQGQSFEDIRAATETAVHDDRNPPARTLNNFGHTLDGSASRFSRSSAVIRNDNASAPCWTARAAEESSLFLF